MPPALCTIISKNYLAYARSLVASFLAQHPQGQAFVLLADELADYDPSNENFVVVTARALNIPNFDQLAFRYTIVEFNTALKPFWFAYLFARYDFSELIYLDSDIYVYQPLTPIYDLLAHYQIVLTPHLLAPLPPDGALPDEQTILRVGIYNLGFIGLARGAQTQAFLAWWQARLTTHCLIDFPQGLFVDQRWIDLVPAFFESVYILRDPAYNMANWNLTQRFLELKDDVWQVNDRLLVFFHFSAFVFEQIEVISKHQTRYTLSQFPALKQLFQQYRAQLQAHGYAETAHLSYAYSFFENGLTVPDFLRYEWRTTDGELKWLTPFSTAPHTFFHWLTQPVTRPNAQPTPLTNFWLTFYRHRPDYQAEFPDPLGDSHDHFVQHLTIDTQLGLDEFWLHPLRAYLTPAPPSSPPAATSAVLSSPSGAPLAFNGWRLIYLLCRLPLRWMRLNHFVKHLLGQRVAEQIYTWCVLYPTPPSLREIINFFF